MSGLKQDCGTVFLFIMLLLPFSFFAPISRFLPQSITVHFMQRDICSCLTYNHIWYLTDVHPVYSPCGDYIDKTHNFALHLLLGIFCMM